MQKITRKKAAFMMLYQTEVLTRIVAMKNHETGKWFLGGVWLDKNIIVCVEAARGGVREWNSLEFVASFCASCGISVWEVRNKVAPKEVR